MTARILVVDDEPGMRAGLTAVLGRDGFAVEAVASGEEALARLRTTEVALLVTDLRLPGLGGLDLLRETRAAGIHAPAIVITAYGTIEDAVTAMKLGAFDFLTKPFSPTDLLHLAKRALEKGAEWGSTHAAGGRDGVAPAATFDEAARPLDECSLERRPRSRSAGGDAVPTAGRPLVTRDPAVLHLLEVAKSVSSSRAPVLIEGESGTGKELLARYLHEMGSRCGGPFVAVNCAALPRDLLESELFGHERGAFTGAIARKTGKFELASGGTLLLDEVSEMEVGLQAKLLRVLQEYEIDRVGGAAPVAVDVRVVATTNRRLRDLVARGRFREDLYYRLSVVPLFLPPLRERRGDVELLAAHFLARLDARVELSPAARAALAARTWPGNVRELENTLERAVLLAGRLVLEPDDLEDAGPGPLRLGGLAGFTVREMERRLILETLDRTGNNRTQAARLLGISIRTLRNKLAEYRQRGELEAPALTGS